MLTRILFVVCILSSAAFSQMPTIEPGVSLELAKWRAARYSDVRYKLNLTFEKMSPVLKGSMEIRVNLSAGTQAPSSGSQQRADISPIILDWRKIKGHEEKSTVSNVLVNGKPVSVSTNWPPTDAGGSDYCEHLIFRDGVVAGENVIKLDFTSPILTSGSAITRYVDKEDGGEYIYSLFVPSDASTAFPVFDQPDLKARFTLRIEMPSEWSAVSNTKSEDFIENYNGPGGRTTFLSANFDETKPISTYVFAFAAGNFERFIDGYDQSFETLLAKVHAQKNFKIEEHSKLYDALKDPTKAKIYVRKSQAAKFKPHAGEVFRLNREGIKFLEQYFDYKFPFPKYDLVLIPEFPFGGMEHAGATFLRESSIIFPSEPTKNDYISRANLIFHETAHQWFGDTVTMLWFDDLWLKEGFATFMAYKAMEKIMPEMNAWKVFYERVKQAAYQTDSTKGTTPIYQEIRNLSAAKSAYGNIVYNKAPAFLRQAEFYLGPDKFQTAVRAFLKKHEFANAGWSDLVDEFANAEIQSVTNPEFLNSPDYPKWKQSSIDSKKEWAKNWVMRPGLPVLRYEPTRLTYRDVPGSSMDGYAITQDSRIGFRWRQRIEAISINIDGKRTKNNWVWISTQIDRPSYTEVPPNTSFFFPNSGDYGYGIFLLDDKSRDYVLKNIGSEKDDFLRTMMWGSLWDSVREAELDPKEYVELVVKNLATEQDESTIQSLLGRVSTAMTYYLSEAQRNELVPRIEAVLIDRMQNAPTLGQRITFYRAFLNIAATENARGVLKKLLATGGNLSGSEGVSSVEQKSPKANTHPTGRVSASDTKLPLKTKDRFDIVTRLAILGDADAANLLTALEKTETSDEAKRYAYAARAGFATAENKAKYWNDFTANKEISESWIEAAFGPWNSIRHSELTLPYLERALKELPNHKRNRKIFFVNGWLAAFIGGHRDEKALAIVNKFLADNPNLDNDLRLKILENVDLIERAVHIRAKYGKN